MAFKNKNMSVIAYANGWTMWQYKTEDSIELIDEDLHYFPMNVVTLMAVGDIIYITSNGTTYQRQIVDIHKRTATIGRVS